MKDSRFPSAGQIATAPYGDIGEIPPIWDEAPYIEPYREFLATDARTVMIILHPNHYNFFINPAMRIDATGWATSGFDTTPTLSTVSWVGQSLLLSGDGTVRFKDNDINAQPAFVYVGPSQDIDSLDWYEPGRSAATWTFSAYVLGGRSKAPPIYAQRGLVGPTSTYGPDQYRVGGIYRFQRSGEITGCRFWRVPVATPAARQMILFRGTTQVALSKPTVETAGSGWVTTTFDPPVQVAAGEEYTIAYDTPTGGYGVTAAAPNMTDSNVITWVGAQYGTYGSGYPTNAVGPYQHHFADVQFRQSPSLETPARARLVMHAYESVEQGIYKSPPKYVGIPSSANPSTEPYGVPEVVGPDGTVWVRKEPPFYAYLDKPPVTTTDPMTIMSTGPMPPVGKDHHLLYNNLLYGLKDPYPEVAGQSLYEKLDTVPPTGASDPSVSLPGTKYLITTGTNTDKDGQVWKLIGPPYYESQGQQAWFASVDGPWIELVDDGEWKRLTVRTDAFSREEDGRVSFSNCAWIDAVVQIENAADVRLSALMLDPKEYPVGTYFDGSMEPEPNLDDYLWSEVDENQAPLANQCISYYYYDMRSRVKWLWDNLQFVVPIGRPYQIFFGSYDRPYLPKAVGTSTSTTALDLSL